MPTRARNNAARPCFRPRGVLFLWALKRLAVDAVGGAAMLAGDGDGGAVEICDRPRVFIVECVAVAVVRADKEFLAELERERFWHPPWAAWVIVAAIVGTDGGTRAAAGVGGHNVGSSSNLCSTALYTAFSSAP